jgi:glycerol-3-phosphate dehydrogenase
MYSKDTGRSNVLFWVMKNEFVVALQDTANNTAYITSIKCEKFLHATQSVTETMKSLSLEVW